MPESLPSSIVSAEFSIMGGPGDPTWGVALPGTIAEEHGDDGPALHTGRLVVHGTAGQKVRVRITRVTDISTIWDKDSWDGTPLYTSGVATITVDPDVLTGADGGTIITQEQVHSAAEGAVAAGIYPLVRFNEIT